MNLHMVEKMWYLCDKKSRPFGRLFFVGSVRGIEIRWLSGQVLRVLGIPV